MVWRILEWIARLLLGGLFLFAGYWKLADPFLFEMAVDSYQLLPPPAVIVVARTLPWLEIVLGLLLWRGWKLPYFAAFTALLLGFFLTLMAVSYSRGVEATCGCFGFGEKVSPQTLIRDTLLFAVAVFLSVSSWREHRARSAATAQPV